MSDLSRLLGDVYRSGPAAAPAEDTAAVDETVEDGTDAEEVEETGVEETGVEEARPATLSGALPEWADESVLDEAFANWVPGPPSDAPQAELGMLSDLAAGPTQAERTAVTDPPPAPSEDRPTSLAEAVPAAPDFMFPLTDGQPAGGPAGPVPGRWQRSDDDLLPIRGRSRSWRRDK
jgi:hypothetical protein